MYDYSFEGLIERFGVGKTRTIWYTVLLLPTDMHAELPFARYPRLRVDGEIADIPVTGAWMPTGGGRRYFIVAPRVMKDAAVGVGDLVEMRFKIADQDAVDMPSELMAALLADPMAMAAWEALTPGRKRGLTHRVHSAKSLATRARRVAEVVTELTGSTVRKPA